MNLLTTLKIEALFTLALFFPLLIQLLILYAVSRALWTFTGRTFGRGLWTMLALVGVPIHELSHAIAFIVTGAGVRRVVLFAPRGLPEYGGATGVVVPARKPSAFSRLVSSVAPFFGCSLVAWLALALLLPGFVLRPAALTLSLADIEAGGLGRAALGLLGAYTHNLWMGFTQLQWADWRTYLAMYVGASLGMSAAPSAEDFRLFFPVLIGLLVILLPVFALLQVFGDPQAVLVAAQSGAGRIMLPIGIALGYATVFALIVLLVLVALAPLRRLRR
jgi:hypothetical protein